MIRHKFSGVAVVALALVATAGSLHAAAAQAVDGLASMHDIRREGRKLCMSDHYHYGSSAGERSKRAAEIAAARSWTDFTIFEYGTGWANFSKSASKEMTCSQGTGGWGCDVSSRPCR